MMQIKLGSLTTFWRYIKTAEDADNGHLIITGRSGSGKTYALQMIERGIAESHEAAMIVLNFHGTHDALTGENVKILDVSDGLPFPLTAPFQHPDGAVDDKDDTIESILTIFEAEKRLPVRQRSALRRAMEDAWNSPPEYFLAAVERQLDFADEDAAGAVADKFHLIFKKIRFCVPDEPLMRPGQIVRLDFGRFPTRLQSYAAEMTLAALLRYFRVWGQAAKYPLCVVCDEFQNLQIRPGSMLAELLREGRKFNIMLFLATQTLDTFDKADRAIIQQAATHLYFRPAASEIRRILAEINPRDPVAMQELLKNLQKGEAIASGRFAIGNIIKDEPIKMTFRKGV